MHTSMMKDSCCGRMTRSQLQRKGSNLEFPSYGNAPLCLVTWDVFRNLQLLTRSFLDLTLGPSSILQNSIDKSCFFLYQKLLQLFENCFAIPPCCRQSQSCPQPVLASGLHYATPSLSGSEVVGVSLEREQSCYHANSFRDGTLLLSPARMVGDPLRVLLQEQSLVYGSRNGSSASASRAAVPQLCPFICLCAATQLLCRACRL